MVRFATGRYCDNPLIVQGPGAGPEVTAGGVFADLLRLVGLSRRAHLAGNSRGSAVLTDVTAFAPATVANVGIGFDILGHTVDAVGDRVRVRRIDEPMVRIAPISGVAGELPLDAERNTAGRAVQAHARGAGARSFGFEIDIEKGIPLASGMGGSAASAVAAVVAANALLEQARPAAASS